MNFGVQAMDRLLSISLAFAALVLTNNVAAQDAAMYTVAGDVPQADIVPFEIGSVVHVLDVLQRSGLAAPEGNALILRGNPLKDVFSDNLIPQMNGRGSQLVPGDIVIFRELAATNLPTRNVVLIADGNPHVIPLNADEVILLRDVTSSFPEHLYEFAVTQTDFGSARSVVRAPNAPLMHGDVIQVRSRNAFGGGRVSSVSHMSDNTAYTNQPAASHTVSVSNDSLLTIPSLTNDTYAFQDGHLSDNEDVQIAGQMELLTRDSSSNKPLSEDPFRQASFEKNASDAFTVLEETESLESTIENNESNAAMWNAMFLLGLVFAMGLIAIGWVKTQNERKAESTARRQNSTAKKPASSNGDLLPNQTASSIPSHQQRHSSIPTEANTVEDGLVPEVGDNCPVLSAGCYEIGFSGLEMPIPELSESTASNINTGSEAEFLEKVGGENTEQRQMGNSLVNEHEWFGADWWKPEIATFPDAAEMKSDMNVASTESPESATAELAFTEAAADSSTLTPVGEPESNSNECWSDLDDLIKNRLPFELQQTELPLRITLFGKPSGPQRLRIDSAHTQIAPPHMSMGARDARRAQPAMQTTGLPAAQQEKTAARPAATEGQPQDSNRFDRALNFLEEQADA